MLRFIIFGDVVGKTGRRAITEFLRQGAAAGFIPAAPRLEFIEPAARAGQRS